MDMVQATSFFHYQDPISARHYCPTLYYIQHSYEPHADPYLLEARHYFQVSYPLPEAHKRHLAPKIHTRTRFTDQQLEVLEQQFEKKHYPDRLDRETLSNQLGLTEANVRVWFQNRRARFRREKKRFDPQPPRKNVKKRPAPLMMPTPQTQSSDSKCQLDSGHLSCPPVPFSPMFSPGSSPGLSWMFKFPPVCDLVTAASYKTPLSYADHSVCDKLRLPLIISNSVGDIKSMESR